MQDALFLLDILKLLGLNVPMLVKQLFLSPKDVAIIFDMSVRQVYYHAHNGSAGFPRPKLIGAKRKFMRFCIEETRKCSQDWRDAREEE